MRKLFFSVLILLSNNACAEWVKLTENNRDDVFYVDPATKKGGNRPRVWILMIYGKPSPGGVRAARSLMEADCLNGATRDLTASYFFDVDLKNQHSTDSEPESWAYPAPSTVRATAYTYLCGKAP